MIAVSVAGIGLLGPGLPDWASGRALLSEPADWRFTPTALPSPMRLPPAERRRAGAIVKVSLAVADQACAQAGVDPARLATVFTASSGDAGNCHALCESLATPERAVSPTRFTNSVHNAAAGYWHIATVSRAPSTSLCAHDASFGAGLLEAAAQCVAQARPVLLVAADVPYPEPLHSARPLPDVFGVALLLTPASDAAPRLRISLAEAAPGTCGHDGLDALMRQVPAARSLPLLQALARGASTRRVIDYLDPLGLAVELQA
ncbi:beta-ketoacyl synthase chain length factor [uncultured Methylibium sp.]|uniref:beta-ketoacyl synthase chain length factor n=1 Tax=uncultured Methylibium sp. TaxID=381093 RepID=UPI0025FC9ACF|nr:beta-ketoacyl synthase chain length factor [uncultured Methylibium sp.]